MDDLISRQMAIECCWDGWNYDEDTIKHIVSNLQRLPSKQPEIIRCKDCSKWCICHHSDDWYCADADKRKD